MTRTASSDPPRDRGDSGRRRPEIRGLRSACLGFAIAFALSSAALTWGRLTVWRPPVEQPIAFNHRLHVEDLDLDCSQCHELTEPEMSAELPTAESCGFCHEEAVGESEAEIRLVSLLEQGKPLDWRPLFRMPPHVFYSHRRHVVVAKIPCQRCHGAIGRSETPPGRVQKLTMEACLDCHASEDAASDCTACHR